MLDAALGELPANSSCLVAALAYRGHDRLTALERAALAGLTGHALSAPGTELPPQTSSGHRRVGWRTPSGWAAA